MPPRLPLLLVLLVLGGHARGQAVSTDRQLWTRYYHFSRISERISLLGEAGLRFGNESWLAQENQTLVRFGAQYHAGKGLSFSAGNAWFWTRRGETDLFVPEIRPWQDVRLDTRLGKWRILNRLRLEERFVRRSAGEELVGGHRFFLRYRYQLQAHRPLGDGGLALILSNELFLQSGPEIDGLKGDQDRVLVGFRQQFSQHWEVQMAYQFIWLWNTAGDLSARQHTARINVFHRIDWRKKEAAATEN